MSPLAGEESPKSYAAGLRTWQFCRALRSGGHEVLLVACRIPFVDDVPLDRVLERQDDALGLRRYDAPEAALVDGSFVARVAASFRPNCVVGAHTHGSWLAARSRPAAPLWCDLNGHLLAEAQTKAATYGTDVHLDYFWGMETAILDAGDAFSVASGPQRYATLGELGLRGRLNRHTVGYELVHHLPVACFLGDGAGSAARLRGSALPSEAFVVLWSGSYNTWTDVDTLFHGLEQAMQADSRIYFLSTGGQVDGHDELTYPAFVRLVERSPYRDRFVLHGWVASPRLPDYYAAADLALNLDDSNVEAELGTRNRIVAWAAGGLPIATTTLCELAADLQDRGLVYGIEPRDPGSLAGAISRAVNDPEERLARAEAARAHVLSAFDCAAVTRPLVEWCCDPSFAPDRGRARIPGLEGRSQAAGLLRFLRRTAAEASAQYRSGGLGVLARRAVRFVAQRALPRRI